MPEDQSYRTRPRPRPCAACRRDPHIAPTTVYLVKRLGRAKNIWLCNNHNELMEALWQMAEDNSVTYPLTRLYDMLPDQAIPSLAKVRANPVKAAPVPRPKSAVKKPAKGRP